MLPVSMNGINKLKLFATLHGRLQSCGSTTSKLIVRCMSTRINPLLLKQTNRTGKLFMLVIPLSSFGLGCWQVERRKWKINLIDTLDTKMITPPVPVPDDLEEFKDLEYRKVRVKGTFDHTREMYVLPRSPVTKHSTGRAASMGTSSGCHVITPLKLHDRDSIILVNRGWVSNYRKNPKNRQEGQIDGEVEFVGVVRGTEQRQPFVAKNDPSQNTWFTRDIIAMSQYADTSPVFVDADDDSTLPNGPIGGQTRVTLRNEHGSYILTWFTLSAITSYMWWMRYIR